MNGALPYHGVSINSMVVHHDLSNCHQQSRAKNKHTNARWHGYEVSSVLEVYDASTVERGFSESTRQNEFVWTNPLQVAAPVKRRTEHSFLVGVVYNMVFIWNDEVDLGGTTSLGKLNPRKSFGKINEQHDLGHYVASIAETPQRSTTSPR